MEEGGGGTIMCEIKCSSVAEVEKREMNWPVASAPQVLSEPMALS